MSEDDYTGKLFEEDDYALSQIGVGAFEFELPEDPLAPVVEDNEMVIDIHSAANGAESLQGAAEMLYNLADELLAVSAEGWEIIDTITNGYGTAVRFDDDYLGGVDG